MRFMCLTESISMTERPTCFLKCSLEINPVCWGCSFFAVSVKTPVRTFSRLAPYCRLIEKSLFSKSIVNNYNVLPSFSNWHIFLSASSIVWIIATSFGKGFCHWPGIPFLFSSILVAVSIVLNYSKLSLIKMCVLSYWLKKA